MKEPAWPPAIKLAGISVRRVHAVSLGHYQAKVQRLVSGPRQDCAGQGEVLGKPRRVHRQNCLRSGAIPGLVASLLQVLRGVLVTRCWGMEAAWKSGGQWDGGGTWLLCVRLGAGLAGMSGDPRNRDWTHGTRAPVVRLHWCRERGTDRSACRWRARVNSRR